MSFTMGCSGGGESATGSSGSGGADAGTTALAVVYGAPAAPAEEPESSGHAVEGYAAAMASHGGTIAIGTTTSVYRLDTTGPVKLDLVGDEPDLPADTGAVRAMASYEGGLLVAAENGLFYTDGLVVQRSLANDTLGPLGITAMSARLASGADGGDAEYHLSILAGSVAYELGGGSMSTWTVDGEAGPPTAVLAQEARVYLSFGARTYEIDKAKKEARPVAAGLGKVHEIACSSLSCEEGSLVYFASDSGLVERGADGVYRRFPLAAEGAPPVPVETFALDAAKQRLYALAGGSVLRIRAGEVPDAVATLAAPAASRRMAVDKAGDVWVGEGLGVKRLALGTPLSFATDVRPILHEYCADCHATGQKGAPVRDFESYDVAVARIDSILMRVQDGTMPPLSTGKKLPKETIQILQDWAGTKAP
ncbi:Hypothetical protein A7982_10124 [Minicystis rosea]|nr:Hypothetical protein A7982_10124 [Minicystis rosea]